MSMLRHGIATEPSRPITLLYGARTEDGHAFSDELRALTRRHPQLQVCYAVSQGATRPEFYAGRIDEALIRLAAPDIAHSISLICGPRGMIDELKGLLQRIGVPPDQIKSEYFEAAIAASTKLRAERDAGVASVDPPAATRVRSASNAAEVTFQNSGVRAAVAQGQTLLEAAEALGVPIASLCRAGVCGSCRTRVVTGQVTCRSDLLDSRERESGMVLACVTTLDGACVVEA
jgi:NADH oxidoreductase Hcr